MLHIGSEHVSKLLIGPSLCNTLPVVFLGTPPATNHRGHHRLHPAHSVSILDLSPPCALPPWAHARKRRTRQKMIPSGSLSSWRHLSLWLQRKPKRTRPCPSTAQLTTCIVFFSRYLLYCLNNLVFWRYDMSVFQMKCLSHAGQSEDLPFAFFVFVRLKCTCNRTPSRQHDGLSSVGLSKRGGAHEYITK